MGFSLSVVVFSDEGFGSSTGFSVVVSSLGDGVFLVRVLVRHFSGSVFVGGLGSFMRQGGGVCVSETDEDLGGNEVGEIDGVFEGEGGVEGSSSSIVVGLTLGVSSMTSGSSMLVTAGFGMSKWTVFGFLLD